MPIIDHRLEPSGVLQVGDPSTETWVTLGRLRTQQVEPEYTPIYLRHICVDVSIRFTPDPYAWRQFRRLFGIPDRRMRPSERCIALPAGSLENAFNDLPR